MSARMLPASVSVPVPLQTEQIYVTATGISCPWVPLISSSTYNHTVSNREMQEIWTQGLRVRHFQHACTLSCVFLAPLPSLCFLPLPSELALINHVTWAPWFGMQAFCSVTPGIACLGIYLEATVASSQFPAFVMSCTAPRPQPA